MITIDLLSELRQQARHGAPPARPCSPLPAVGTGCCSCFLTSTIICGSFSAQVLLAGNISLLSHFPFAGWTCRGGEAPPVLGYRLGGQAGCCDFPSRVMWSPISTLTHNTQVTTGGKAPVSFREVLMSGKAPAFFEEATLK